MRKCFLLGANIFFYAWWSWKFALMLLASAMANHCFGKWIHSTVDAKRRKRILFFSIAANVLLLAFFKYAGFLFAQVFIPLCIPLCNWLGTAGQLAALQEQVLPFIASIVLPVGISFYTFEAISFLSDVYWKKTVPAQSALDFANYLAFFPNLLAGPINRAGQLLPQLARLPSFLSEIDTGRAATLILSGLFKKTVLANWLSQNLVERVFEMPEEFCGLDTLLGAYGYTLQIYCDFSAYSDMAVGIALLLGIHFPVNFDAPYLSVTLQEFWRRWHMTLSSWLRDYLYIPLGGSRKGSLRTKLNLVATFLVGGLWHGAGWTFILWGAYHGIYLALERTVRGWIGLPARPSTNPGLLARLAGRLWIFNVATFGWILFRCDSLEQVSALLEGLCKWQTPVLLNGTCAAVLTVAWLSQYLDGERLRKIWDEVNSWPAWLQGTVCAVLLTIILGIGPSGVAPFIYFQF